MRDKIIFSVTGKLQELLLREDKINLDKAIKICRAYEQSNKHVKELRESTSSTHTVNKVTHHDKFKKKAYQPESKRPQTRYPQSQSKTSYNTQTNNKECNFCGYKHERKKEKCHAWGKTCHAGKGAESKNISALMNVNDCDVRFQLDSAADVNTICKRYIRKEQVKPSTITLRMWNKTPMKPIGEVHLKLINPKNGDETMATLVVVPNGHMNLLGLETIRRMGLITVNDDRFIAKVETQKIGDLGEITLKVDENVPAKTLPSRKLPLSLQDDVKKEIDKLVERQVLIPVTEPSKWVSQMAVVRKPNGKLRICIDPQPLNTAMMREHYKLPTLDYVLPKLANAKIFQPTGFKEAYWHVKLDKESSDLTTMITPFGRYRWARLPFGLKVSSEIISTKAHRSSWRYRRSIHNSRRYHCCRLWSYERGSINRQ
ncbi:Hypothetical predicted protein [Mytilus galloprovincialis]|uniref:Reverse transcriptase domain-containing protein n=1 Tax=Mytilus galloprovincialis TaxID=29158 RepID=A0A8B6C5C8_MYTGA|nr:Hypothetical predicted protein [Mytilus galloprovincialis]